jgi:Fe-S oxidoreductase
MEEKWSKLLVAWALRVTDKRSLPKIIGGKARRLVTKDAEKSKSEKIIFLPDVFSRYIEPQVEEAALDVLRLCGYDVRVLPVIGAGASLLSKGFVDAARHHARKTLELLNQIDPAREAVIVGVEPPEIYLLKNEYVDLLPECAQEILTKRAWLLDEFLVRSKEFETLRAARFMKQNQIIFFHPHCHQRAQGPSPDGTASGANASAELLRACGYDVELSNAGCCGMAGTFGYEAEHYALSMKIAELKLLPWIRNSAFGTRESGFEDRMSSFSSSGAACRIQIHHGTGIEAKHPIEWVREALVNS